MDAMHVQSGLDWRYEAEDRKPFANRPSIMAFLCTSVYIYSSKIKTNMLVHAMEGASMHQCALIVFFASGNFQSSVILCSIP